MPALDASSRCGCVRWASASGSAARPASLVELLTGARPAINGTSELTLADSTEAILACGLTGIRRLAGRARRLQLDGYRKRVDDRDIPDAQGSRSAPRGVARWMAAYAAATATTTTSFAKICDAASPGQERKPAKETVQGYRDALARVWISTTSTLGSRPTTAEPARARAQAQLADPGARRAAPRRRRARLQAGRSSGPAIPRDGHRSVRCSRASSGSQCGSTPPTAKRACATCVTRPGPARGRPDRRTRRRSRRGDRGQADPNSRERRRPAPAMVGDKLGNRLLDSIVVTTGPAAYRCPDYVAFVPLALLGEYRGDPTVAADRVRGVRARNLRSLARSVVGSALWRAGPRDAGPGRAEPRIAKIATPASIE